MNKHTVKVSDLVYEELQQMQRPRETLGEVVARLQNIAILVTKVVPLLTSYRSELVLGTSVLAPPAAPDPRPAAGEELPENTGEEG